VIDELKCHKKRYKAKSVHLYDDTFILDKKWVLEFCRKYKKEINLPFYCLVRANLIDEEMTRALKKAGCVCVGMGIESGNPEIRNKLLKRGMSTEQIVNASRIIKKYKIKLVTFNMFGFPGETPEQMLDTMRLNLKIRPDSLFANIFYPFYGTDLMKECLKKGYINEDVVEDIIAGNGNYHSRSLLKHPHSRIAYNMKVILPLLNKLPRTFHPYFLKKWIFKRHSNFLLDAIKMFSIPFYSRWEAPQRLKEQISMMKVHYLTKLKNNQEKNYYKKIR
jgi:hypothetical protein